MKKGIRKAVLFLALAGLYTGAVHGKTLVYDGISHEYNDLPISLYIEGKQINTSQMDPVQIDGYTLVPAREVFQETGALVLWKAAEQKVYIDNKNSLIVLEINNNTAWVNGSETRLDMPAKMINGKVMIPTRFVGETLGYQVTWQSETRSVQMSRQSAGSSAGNSTGNTGSSAGSSTGNTGSSAGNSTGNTGSSAGNSTGNTGSSAGSSAGNTGSSTENSTGNTGSSSTGSSTGNSAASNNSTNSSAAGDDWINEEHIKYEADRQAIVLKGISQLKASDIQVTEQYHQKQIIIQLNKNCTNELQTSSWYGPTGPISSVQITQADTGTQITLTTRKIMALKVSQENGSIVLACVKPSEKYDKIVVVDAGHGDHDSGANGGGYHEKDLNLKFALALGRVLDQDPGIKVYLTREDDTFLKLDERTAMANEIDPDLFISIHINSAGSSASGIETYYTKKSDTRNKTFATMVQKALVDAFGKRDRGVKSNTFVVTKNTNAPAILIEIGFITNNEDLAMMTADSFPQEYAQVLYKCILQYYNQGLNRK